MPTYQMRFAGDSDVGGIPSGGRGAGWVTTGTSDHGLAVRVGGDGEVDTVSAVTTDHKLRMVPDINQILDLTNLLGAVGQIQSVTGHILHRSFPVTTSDNGQVSVQMQLEYPSQGTLMSVAYLQGSTLANPMFVQYDTGPISLNPAGLLWTPAILRATVFDAYVFGTNGNHPLFNNYEIDQFYLTVDYSTGPFPDIPAAGGQACNNDLPVLPVTGAQGCAI